MPLLRLFAPIIPGFFMPHLHSSGLSAGDAGAPDFTALDALLRESAAAMEAAESHGHLCGLICAAGEVAEAFWIEQVFGGFEAGEAGCSDCEPLLADLYAWTRATLRSEDLGFRLHLPDDECPLRDRVRAMRAWCQGFLSGVGLGSASVSSMPAAAEEVLQDMAEMAWVSEEPQGDPEEEERAYAEIVEYLRAGVWLLVDELGQVRARPSACH